MEWSSTDVGHHRRGELHEWHRAFMTLTIDRLAAHLAGVGSPIPLLRTAELAHVEREITHGRLTRVRRGVVAPAARWRALKPWQRYSARVHAVALLFPGLTFSHESAAALLGLPIFGEPLEVHVLDTPERTTSRASGGIRRHTTLGDRVITRVRGILVTSPLDTAIDLARSRHGAIGLSVADAARRANPEITVETLTATNESRASARGRRVARWALHRASSLAETPLESVSRAAIEWLGFDEPLLQRELRTDGTVDRVDMWWEHTRVVGEADGDIKYDGSLQSTATAIRKEKERDRRLLRHASAIAHFGWADVTAVTPLREVLFRAGLRPVRPESSRELHALTELLRPRSPRDPALAHLETAMARRDSK